MPSDNSVLDAIHILESEDVPTAIDGLDLAQVEELIQQTLKQNDVLFDEKERLRAVVERLKSALNNQAILTNQIQAYKEELANYA